MKPGREQITRVHRHAWLWEPLENEPGFLLRTMFGAKAAYLDGKIVLCFCIKEDPWCGLLVPTERAQHEALRAELTALVPHPILGKWLYLPESADAFERTATALVALIRRRDPRLGVTPQPKRRKRRKSSDSARAKPQSRRRR